MERILCFYTKSSDKTNFDIISKCLNTLKFDITNDYLEAQKLYTDTDYKIVLVDFTTKEGKRLLEYITTRNIQQRVITMSEKLECSVKEGCTFCLENYRRKRVLKPFDLKELIDLIQNYDNTACNYSNKFENIIDILDKIILRYDTFYYEFENKIIKRKDDKSIHIILQELMDITELLTQNNISYSINSKYDIILNTNINTD